MTQYELSFVTDSITEQVENNLLEHGYFIERHGALTLVTRDSVGSDAYRAAVLEAEKLELLGVRVRRLNLDLVNMVQIAERVGLTKQAVHKWTTTTSFPAPHASTGGLLWAWSDVNEWLARVKPDKQDHLHQATPQEVARFDSMWECERSGVDVAQLAPEPTRTTIWGDIIYRGQTQPHAVYITFQRVDREPVGHTSKTLERERVDA